MPGHKLAIAVLLTAHNLTATGLSAASDDLPAPPSVVISSPHREFLSRVARRTVTDTVAARGTYQPGYTPDALASQSAEVMVRIRHHGYLLGVGVGGQGPITTATRDASLIAGRVVAQAEYTATIDELLIEIEVIGQPVPLSSGTDWTKPGTADAAIEPGIDGVVVVAGDKARRVCPSDMIASDLPVADALKLLAQGLQLSGNKITQTPLMRFRTAHWYEPQAGQPIVSLHRGLTVVPPEAVSSRGLKESIDRAAEYMTYRQRASGLFAYRFEPGADRYSDEDNVVRQVGATLGLAMHARSSGKSASLAAADAAIAYHLQGLTDVPSVEGAAFIATADGSNKLGVTALLALAVTHHPNPQGYEAVRRRLVKGMLFLQRPSGMFMTAFPPALDVGGQDYFPGEALLALGAEYDRDPSAEILQAFDRAIDFYRDYFEGSRSPAFVPWQVQAFALMARHTKRQDYIDYVFALADYLAAKQLTVANCPWPELHGGIAAHSQGRAGVATASYLEAFADALDLARQVKDEARARRYEDLVRQAARFIMQLQVRPEEAYYMRSPTDAVGGIRTAPALNTLRIDHCQHALVALMKTHDALFPSGN